MAPAEISPRSSFLLRTLAGAWADRYLAESLLPSLSKALEAPASFEGIEEAFSDPFTCLKGIYLHYAFARRGKDRQELAEIAAGALDATTSKAEMGRLLAQRDASSLWLAFEEMCGDRGRKPMEQLNRGIVSGMAELAQEIYREDGHGSIADWVVDGIVRAKQVEPQFLRIVDIRGVGPKLTSVILRDLVYVYDLEERLHHADRLYIQPIDKWIRLLAKHIIDEPGIDRAADWILAGKLAKYARYGEVSGIRLNMGATLFGIVEAKSPQDFDNALDRLVKGEGLPGRASRRR